MIDILTVQRLSFLVPALPLAECSQSNREDGRLWLLFQSFLDPASSTLDLSRIVLAAGGNQHIQSGLYELFRVGGSFPEPLALIKRLFRPATVGEEGGQRQMILNTI